MVGGLGSLPGLVLGALFIQYLPALAGHVSTRQGVPEFVYGAAIIVVIILLPEGRARCSAAWPLRNKQALHSSIDT